jgi:hypothetical protein
VVAQLKTTVVVERLKNTAMAKKGLYANIHAKRRRIKAGSGEKMRSPGDKGAPSSKDFEDAAKTRRMYDGGPVRAEIARGCGKVMNNRRKKTKYF